MRLMKFLILFILLFPLGILAQNKAKMDSLLTIVERGKADTTLINAYNELATALLGADDKRARDFAFKGLRLSTKLKNNSLKGWSYNLLGLAYDYLAQPDSALYFYRESIAVKRKINDIDGIASSYLNIGVMYLYQNDYDKALSNYKTALKIYIQTKNEKRIAGLYNNIGSVYRQQKKYKEAIEMYEQSYTIKVKIKDTTGISNALGNLGIVYQHLGDYKKSEELQLKSLELDRLSHNTYNYISSCIGVAELKTYQKQYDKCKKYLDTAIALGLKINAVHYLDDAYKVYTNLDSLTGNFKDAFKHLRLYHKYNAIVVREENTQQLNKLEVVYDTREKEQKIVLLNAKAQITNLKIQKRERQLTWFILLSALFLTIIVLIFFGYRSLRRSRKTLAEQNYIIQQSLEEKEILLKEIHHRVKNNLQVISSLLSIQSRYIKDEKALEAINESKDRVTAISLLHQEIYKNEVLKTIQADAYLRNLTKGIQNTFDPNQTIRVEMNLMEMSLDVDQLIPIGLIVNELLTNAYKYGGKHIQLDLTHNLDTATLSIYDNGTGIPLHFDPAQSTSLGFKLINMLTQKLKGTIRFDNTPGLKATLQFKIKA
jgi:two-component sensor histidine kinase